ncbi:MAG: hypothetical protein WBA54_11160, partial [Acidaminobacteraceae bacterium]
ITFTYKINQDFLCNNKQIIFCIKIIHICMLKLSMKALFFQKIRKKVKWKNEKYDQSGKNGR